MLTMKPLITTVMDLNAALGGRADLLLGGGLGLYLKQEHLRATGARTLLSLDRLPPARATQDVDLFLRAEVIASKEEVTRYRAALDKLGFVVVPGSQWLKFTRSIGGTDVLLDVMVGPLGEHANTVRLKDSRARPTGLGGKSGLHAFATEEALGIERGPLRIPLTAADSDGNNATCDVLIPRAFPYALMKLGALRDRVNDESKQEGRHHAMDLYRIVGLLTEEEIDVSERSSKPHERSTRCSHRPTVSAVSACSSTSGPTAAPRPKSTRISWCASFGGCCYPQPASRSIPESQYASAQAEPTPAHPPLLRPTAYALWPS
jgi:hypothetical protein